MSVQFGSLGRSKLITQVYDGKLGSSLGTSVEGAAKKSNRIGLILIRDAQRQRPSFSQGWAPATLLFAKIMLSTPQEKCF